MNAHNTWLQPIFSSPSVFIPAFKASLQSGHFVKVFKEGNFLVGRIINTTHELSCIDENERGPWLDAQVHNRLGGFVKLNWFLPRSLLSFANPEMAAASSNIYTSDNIEVFQTKLFSWLRTSELLEICFVFKYGDVVDGRFCCEGISNAFYCRYRYVNDSLLEPICKVEDPFFSFPSLSPTFTMYWCHCWSTELWDSIIMVQQAITGLLCRYSQRQGKHPEGRSRISIQASLMHYINAWLRNRNVFPSAKRWSRMLKHVRSGVIFKKIKVDATALCWRFDTETKLDVLSQLLGKNIAVGIRRRPPKLGVSYSVRENDSLNVVVGNLAGDPDPTKKTDCRGIDFLYHEPYLDVYVRSSEYIASRTEHPPTESLRSQLTNLPAPVDEWRRSVMLSNISLKVKQRFQFCNSVFRIQNIDGNEVHAICVYGEGKGSVRVFESDEVTRNMINNFSK